jgi:hypothetical protein
MRGPAVFTQCWATSDARPFVAKRVLNAAVQA